jgi:adenylate cyclase
LREFQSQSAPHQAAPRVAPFALGWAGALARRGVPPEAPAREIFRRQILIGIAVSIIATSLVTVVPHLLTGNATGLISVALTVSLIGGLLARFVGRRGAISSTSHVMVALLFASPLLSSIAFPQQEAFINYAFALPCPVLATLLVGVRGGVLWSGILLADLLLIFGGPELGLPLEAGIDLSGYVKPAALTSFLGLVTLLLLLFVTWFVQQRKIAERLLEDEREQARQLLRAAVPPAIADRLEAGESIADALPEVTVIFADIVGFTTLSASVPPREVVTMLSRVFADIDAIAEEVGVEKIKTIGDCYMAVVGAPTPVPDHADRALRFCLRVNEALRGGRFLGAPLTLRFGVHTGPVVAGIIGRQRMLYDVWGDTVNTASRIESAGLAGEIQLSEATAQRCREPWRLEARGVVPLRGRDGVRCFLLRPEGAPAVAPRAGG